MRGSQVRTFLHRSRDTRHKSITHRCNAGRFATYHISCEISFKIQLHPAVAIPYPLRSSPRYSGLNIKLENLKRREM
ncbi:hypothetical protein C362_00040 [Cryptococcus neoformans Bt1]|nr:hypothetical protein C362_00040 [Cryptococcus neoformans var. grubii Bt1]